MKTIYYFLFLLYICNVLKFKKTPIHPTFWSYIKHSWRLAKEINED
jgi:hypothetical protein